MPTQNASSGQSSARGVARADAHADAKPAMGDYEIIKLWEDVEVGFWRAIVRARGIDVELCDEHGSWQTPPLDASGRRREALPRVARDLQRLRHSTARR